MRDAKHHCDVIEWIYGSTHSPAAIGDAQRMTGRHNILPPVQPGQVRAIRRGPGTVLGPPEALTFVWAVYDDPDRGRVVMVHNVIGRYLSRDPSVQAPSRTGWETYTADSLRSVEMQRLAGGYVLEVEGGRRIPA